MCDEIKFKFENIYFILFLYLFVFVIFSSVLVSFFTEKVNSLEMLHNEAYCSECGSIYERK